MVPCVAVFRFVLRWSLGLSAGALLAPGCGSSCEDDGFGGANCIASGGPIAQEPTTGGQTSTGSDDPDASSTSSSSGAETGESSSSGSVETQSWCIDSDSDGYGNAADCQDVPEGDTPPEGWVLDDTDCDDTSDRTYPGAATAELVDACTTDADQDGWADAAPADGVEAGTDCDDADGSTHPGAAELDDDTACMRDADDDGYGDSMPPRGGQAGTDCDDADTDVPSASACLTWCLDADDDQYGDPESCVVDTAPPDDHVGNDADCDDSSPDTFPGAAPLDDDTACMADVDGDDYGDDTPSDASIAAGSDCDDAEVLVFDACFDCPADTLYCNGDDNVSQCNGTGTWGVQVEACSFGCDDVGAACWSALSVDAGTCAEKLDGGAASLTASAMGGDGDYDYLWTPAAGLSATDTATVSATPPRPSTYAVQVTDGEGNEASDAVTVHVTDRHWNLELDGCTSHSWADIFDAPAPPPTDVFFANGEAHCNLANNSLPNAFVCSPVMDQARVSFDMEVISNTDSDGIGFVWGWQDPSHFYLLSWKQVDEAAPWGTWSEGITIKRIEADDPADITGEDLAADYDTAHGTVLATGDDFTPAGWANRVLYRVTLDLEGDTTTITIDDLDNGGTVTTGQVVDAALGPGAVGSYNASQRTACTDHWSSSCL